MRNVVTKSIKRLVQLRDIVSTALTAGNNGKSLAMTWDDSAQTLTLTKDPAFDTVVLPDGRALPSATASRTFYVATTGSDSNDGSIGSPFLTGQKAADTVAGIYWGPYIPTIQYIDGQYGRVVFRRVFAPRVQIRGNASDPSLVRIATTENLPGGCFLFDKTFSRYQIRDISFSTHPSSQCIYVADTIVDLQGTNRFEAGARKLFYTTGSSGFLINTTIEFVEASNAFGISATSKAILNCSNLTVRCTQATNFSAGLLHQLSGSEVNWTNLPLDGGGAITGVGLNCNGSFLTNYNSATLAPSVILDESIASGTALGRSTSRTVESLSIVGSTPSTSPTTGALVVGNSVGIGGGNINASGSVSASVAVVAPILRPTANGTTAVRVQNANGSTTLQIFDTTNNRVGHPVFSSFSAGVQFGSDAPDFGGGSGAIIGIDNAATAPTTNPIDGVVVYAEGGAFRVRDVSGNIGQVVHDGAQSFSGVKTFTDNPAISKSAGVAGQLNFATNGILRWQIEKTAAAETGGNAGSNLIVNRYDDGGGYTGTFLQLFRDTGKLEIYAETEFTGALRIPQGTPASASSPGARGQIVHDADYIYICVAANTWKRTALTTW